MAAVAVVAICAIAVAVTAVTGGAGSLGFAVAIGALKGAAIGFAVGAAVGVQVGAVVGGICAAVNGTDFWSGVGQGALLGLGIGAFAGAIVGAIVGGSIAGTNYVKAANFLKANNVTDVKGVMRSFKGTPKLETLKADTTVYRYWGGNSPMKGPWASPMNYGANARSMLSLPSGNTMGNLYVTTVSKGTIVLQGKAAALFNQIGGGIQWWIALLP